MSWNVIKIAISNMCLSGCTRLAQKLKSTFFEIFSSLAPLKKNIEFSLWVKQCGFSKLHFFRILAHYVLSCWNMRKTDSQGFQLTWPNEKKYPTSPHFGLLEKYKENIFVVKKICVKKITFYVHTLIFWLQKLDLSCKKQSVNQFFSSKFLCRK